MSRTLIRTLAALALITLASCATLKGMGTDIGNIGDAITTG